MVDRHYDRLSYLDNEAIMKYDFGTDICCLLMFVTIWVKLRLPLWLFLLYLLIGWGLNYFVERNV